MFRQIPIHYKDASDPVVIAANPVDNKPIEVISASNHEAAQTRKRSTSDDFERRQDPFVNIGKIEDESDCEPSGIEEDNIIAELQKQLDDARKREQELLQEFHNYKRRAEETIAKTEEKSKHKILIEMADLIHAFELAKSSARTDPGAIHQGLELIADSLEKIFTEHGVERIRTINEIFNPEFHEAVLAEKAEGYEKGTIIRELVPGFRIQQEVIQPAKVIVAL